METVKAICESVHVAALEIAVEWCNEFNIDVIPTFTSRFLPMTFFYSVR